jgi:hypothetical protein
MDQRINALAAAAGFPVGANIAVDGGSAIDIIKQIGIVEEARRNARAVKSVLKPIHSAARKLSIALKRFTDPERAQLYARAFKVLYKTDTALTPKHYVEQAFAVEHLVDDFEAVLDNLEFSCRGRPGRPSIRVAIGDLHDLYCGGDPQKKGFKATPDGEDDFEGPFLDFICHLLVLLIVDKHPKRGAIGKQIERAIRDANK